MPLGVLLVMKTLEDRWYIVINAYQFTVFEIWRDFLYYHILHVRAIPTLESTDSTICNTFSVIHEINTLRFYCVSMRV